MEDEVQSCHAAEEVELVVVRIVDDGTEAVEDDVQSFQAE